MPANVRDESLSPRTQSPRRTGPVNGDARTASNLPNGSGGAAQIARIKARQLSRTDASTTEARDYWNGGSPHASASVVEGSTTVSEPQNTSLPQNRPTDYIDAPAAGQGEEAVSDAVPPPRKSVQFVRSDPDSPSSHTRHGSGDGLEGVGRSRSSAFMSKIKSLATTAGQSPKSPNGPTTTAETGTNAIPSSPSVNRFAGHMQDVLTEEDSEEEVDMDDADADVEETGDEANGAKVATQQKKKRRIRRPRRANFGSVSALGRFGQGQDSFGHYNMLLRRRASMPDASAPGVAISEGDDTDRMPSRPFRSNTTWVSSPLRSPGGEVDGLDRPVAPGRRYGHIRRLSAFGAGGGVSDGDAATPRRPFFRSERASTFGANKWKQVKNTLKLLRQKKEDRFDYLKSAELMAELRAGAPAVLMFASMIQRDEHGNRRIPVLLEQLKLRVKDSAPMPDDDKERHWLFTMELEYGSGPSRMSWTITRTIREIYNIHLRYKLKLNNEKYLPGRVDLGARLKQPKFPYSAFPYLRNARNKDDSSDDSDDEQGSVNGEDTAADGIAGDSEPANLMSDAEDRPPAPRRKRSRVNLLGRRLSSGLIDPGDTSNFENRLLDVAARRQRYAERQRRTLEKYLTEMIRWLMFRADSNRLCRFLELSALGVRLAAEGSYHGKEGFLHIQTSKGLDFRRVLTPAKVISRHSRKWFLVRQSYIVCVESPENMNIYDVYLVDSSFKISSKRNALKQMRSKSKKTEIDLTEDAPPEKHHTLMLHTSERKIRLFSRYQSAMKQFEASINEMLRRTPWGAPKRFDSFAPVRTGVFAQWLVDGRDYMWNVSRAINMAKDVIYIHDWWLSPELYMRRPACISQKWRLDRLLQKKAREGVKIFVIIYRNVEAAVPIDSEYSKFSLLNLHPNIFVQRSPNQFKKNQFFFAHHEKICVVDHDVAFVGGIDLCFGRWDCPQHPIVDDKPTGFELSELPKDAEHTQLFAGKDYSNPRVQDFFRLNEPYEEMYDRSRVPRMPWHDISMQVVGQPARDLTRHFIQRWNYLRRGRRPTRPLPFLLPPPDAKVEELEALGLTGTCEVQILRSASTWSLGIDSTEHSIQTAYIKMIEDSDHFVYIENQFFISSTDVYNTRITNRIGDALVERIIRAHQNEEDWRCVVVIPLMPGFQNTVDEQEGTSVRLILMCQFRSICRGEQSIFGRLRAAGIEPEDYISFYSLRQWGIMSTDMLVTEQLYIHSKTIIVDDRVALIGSANINERSMIGSRDSECAAIVRDTDMIWSTMAGKPYRVARFAHTLRLRLMREHLGLDTDEIQEQERQQDLSRETFETDMDEMYAEEPASPNMASPSRGTFSTKQDLGPERLPSFNHDLDLEKAEAHTLDSTAETGNVSQSDPRVTGNMDHQLDLSGYGLDQWRTAEATGLDAGRDSVVVNGREVLVHNVDSQGKATLDSPAIDGERSPAATRAVGLAEGNIETMPPVPPLDRRSTVQLGLTRVTQLPPLPVVDDTDIGGPPVHFDPVTGEATTGAFHPLAADITLAHIDKDCMRDPVNSSFFDDVWNRAAQNNTKLYRRVFRCMPDSEVSTWTEYREYVEYGEKFRASMEGRPKSTEPEAKSDAGQHQVSTSAGAGIAAPGPEALVKAAEQQVEKISEKVKRKLSGTAGVGEKSNMIVPEADDMELNEKQRLDEGGISTAQTQSRPNLDTHVASGGHRASEAASPIYSQGDVLFPDFDKTGTKNGEAQASKDKERKATFSTMDAQVSKDGNTAAATATQSGSVKRRRRATTRGSRRTFSIENMPSREDAEELLNMVQGNLVQFPYDWLLTEEHNGNWGYQVDGVAPLAI